MERARDSFVQSLRGRPNGGLVESILGTQTPRNSGVSASGAATFSSVSDAAPIPKAMQLSEAAITQVIEERLAEFSPQVPVFIRDSIGDVLGSTANDSGPVAGGMVHDGKIYLFRDGLANTADVAKTLWHELLHDGLRRLLTKEQYIGRW